MPSFSYSPNCNDSVFVIININKLYPCFMAINLVPSLLFIIICTIVFYTRKCCLHVQNYTCLPTNSKR